MSTFAARSGPAGDPAVPTALAARLWRADSLYREPAPVWPTGHAALDVELPGGGWPASGLTELLFDAPGCGELRLLAPALGAADGDLLWVAPPAVPYAPALQALGLMPPRLIWLNPDTAADAAWAAEQTLRAGCCAAVLWWGDAATAMLRRLHLAAAGTPLFALRPWGAQAQASPAPLRLACAPAPQGRLSVHVVKRRGPPMAVAIELALPLPASLKKRKEVGDALARRAPALVAA